MTNQEKYLYHQIHPLKLLTDWGAGVVSLYALWRHELALALVIMLAPPPIASFLVIRFADLERYKESSFGRYIARYMTRTVQAVRLGGMVISSVGAWHRSLLMIATGIVIIVVAGLRGVLIPKP